MKNGSGEEYRVAENRIVNREVQSNYQAYQAPGGSDMSSPASFGGTGVTGGGPIRLKPDFAPSTRCATQSHNCPFRTPHRLTVRPHLAFGIILIGAASSPDCVLARDPRQIAVPVTGRNSFILPIIPQARNRMQLPRRHAPSASWVIVPLPRSGTNSFARRRRLINGQIQQIICRMRF